MSDQQFNWIDFYTEFADKLRAFRNDRKKLIDKIAKVYSDIGIKLPKLGNEEVPDVMDPFTVFGLFNKGITKENRIKIIQGMKDKFGVKAAVPNEFPGVPVLNNLSATFYRFGNDRGKDDINNLWNVFEAALNYADNETAENRKRFSECFDLAIAQLGVKWNLTMGLYWIRPYSFINLDTTNRFLLSDPEKINVRITEMVKNLKTVPSAEKYLQIRDETLAALKSGKYGHRSFPEFSFNAWLKSGEDDQGGGTGTPDIATVRYWLYAPGEGAKMWDDFYGKGVMAIGWSELGDLKDYTGKRQIAETLKERLGSKSSYTNSAQVAWQFAKELKQGDIIYAKKGRKEIIGYGIVESDYLYDKNFGGGEYPNIRKVKWIKKGKWQVDESFALKTLTDVTDYLGLIDKVNSLLRVDDEIVYGGETDPAEVDYPGYTSDDFLKEVFISEEEYYKLVDALKGKKNIILQGAPGVGKTFLAKRLAFSIMGVKDVERVMMVQFHQSYSYEDFIMGFRPSAAGFELKKGAFYNFCKKAQDDTDNDYYFIIDEINRGNLSKIFGELFMLIENDKRGNRNKLQLLYSDELFYVPENVYIIGMMNTADRSLAILDYALRRRFAFFDLKPGFSSDGFKDYQAKLDDHKFNKLISCVEDLNSAIAEDESLGEGFCIGHSFFCRLTPDKIDEGKLSGIVETELVPLLKEYWFDEPDKVEEWAKKLRSAVE